MAKNVDQTKLFGVLYPLIYVTNGILATTLGVIVSKDDITFESPILVIFGVCLISFLVFFGYIIVKKSYLLLPEDKRAEIEKDIVVQKGQQPQEQNLKYESSAGFKPKKST